MIAVANEIANAQANLVLAVRAIDEGKSAVARSLIGGAAKALLDIEERVVAAATPIGAPPANDDAPLLLDVPADDFQPPSGALAAFMAALHPWPLTARETARDALIVATILVLFPLVVFWVA